MGTPDLTRDVWGVDAEQFPAGEPIEERARFLLRYAILAPSSHNSQPWEFVLDGGQIEVHGVEDRWLDVADRDRRELYLSLGCALENLCVAAERFGIDYSVEYHDDADHHPAAVDSLDPDGEPSSGRPPGLFEEITDRRTSHDLFDGEPLPPATRERLEQCVLEDAVSLHVVTDLDRKQAVAELQAQADVRQMENPEYRKELAHWIGIGALGDSWLRARIGQAVLSHFDVGDREAQKNSKLVQSAPAVAVLATDTDSPAERVRAGQVFERMALAASADGVAVHPMSQILERPELRSELAATLDGERTPQHLFRLGFAAERGDHTPRWPLETFLVERS